MDDSIYTVLERASGSQLLWSNTPTLTAGQTEPDILSSQQLAERKPPWVSWLPGRVSCQSLQRIDEPPRNLSWLICALNLKKFCIFGIDELFLTHAVWPEVQVIIINYSVDLVRLWFSSDLKKIHNASVSFKILPSYQKRDFYPHWPVESVYQSTTLVQAIIHIARRNIHYI